MLLTQPSKYYAQLPSTTLKEVINSPSPSLVGISKLVGTNGKIAIKAIILLALTELADFFNVGKNLSQAQLSLTADLIIERFYYFKLEDIKLCFHRAMANEQVFDRLDGNIIMRWLREYDKSRTELAMDMSDQAETQAANQVTQNGDAITAREYLQELAERAKTDSTAAEILSDMQRSSESTTQAERDSQFKQWFYGNYLATKQQKSSARLSQPS
jgi:hypothetical protein